MTSDIWPPVKPLLTKTKVFLPPPLLATASGNERRGTVPPTPNSLGGTKKFFAYEMKKKKIIGAKKARIRVPSHCRQKQISSVFSTSAYHCRMSPILLSSQANARYVRESVCLTAKKVATRCRYIVRVRGKRPIMVVKLRCNRCDMRRARYSVVREAECVYIDKMQRKVRMKTMYYYAI